jgi:hypothetical protein
MSTRRNTPASERKGERNRAREEPTVWKESIAMLWKERIAMPASGGVVIARLWEGKRKSEEKRSQEKNLGG